MRSSIISLMYLFIVAFISSRCDNREAIPDQFVFSSGSLKSSEKVIINDKHRILYRIEKYPTLYFFDSTDTSFAKVILPGRLLKIENNIIYYFRHIDSPKRDYSNLNELPSGYSVKAIVEKNAQQISYYNNLIVDYFAREDDSIKFVLETSTNLYKYIEITDLKDSNSIKEVKTIYINDIGIDAKNFKLTVDHYQNNILTTNYLSFQDTSSFTSFINNYFKIIESHK